MLLAWSQSTNCGPGLLGTIAPPVATCIQHGISGAIKENSTPGSCWTKAYPVLDLQPEPPLQKSPALAGAYDQPVEQLHRRALPGVGCFGDISHKLSPATRCNIPPASIIDARVDQASLKASRSQEDVNEKTRLQGKDLRHFRAVRRDSARVACTDLHGYQAFQRDEWQHSFCTPCPGPRREFIWDSLFWRSKRLRHDLQAHSRGRADDTL